MSPFLGSDTESEFSNTDPGSQSGGPRPNIIQIFTPKLPLFDETSNGNEEVLETQEEKWEWVLSVTPGTDMSEKVAKIQVDPV